MTRKSSVLLCVISLFWQASVQGQTGKLKEVQKIITSATDGNLPGIAVYIKNKNGEEWTGVAGFSNIETKQLLQKDDIFAIGSIGKMYNAVAVLKLVEEGRLKLDDKISQYLSEEIIANLPNGPAITIRHLLGQTTGLYNYDHSPELNERYIAGQIKLDTLSHLNALRRYVFGKPALFPLGSKYDYSSTNYMLIAMIVDSVLPQGHSDYLRKNLLSTAGFTNTYYRQTPPANMVNHYGDLNQDHQLENLTNQTIETSNWFIGDDGIYSSAAEAGHFLESLMKGKIISKESLNEMTKWNDAKRPDYGLGLMADKGSPYKMLVGHSGRGIGMTTDLYYFPYQDMTIAIFCNAGIRASSPEFKKAYIKMRTKIIKCLFVP